MVATYLTGEQLGKIIASENVRGGPNGKYTRRLFSGC